MVTADPPYVSGAFGAGAVDYGYERPPSRPRKDRGAWKADAPAGGATTSAWRPMAPPGLGFVEVDQLGGNGDGSAPGGVRGFGFGRVGQLWS